MTGNLQARWLDMAEPAVGPDPGPTSLDGAAGWPMTIRCVHNSGRLVEASVSVFPGAQVVLPAVDTQAGSARLELADWTGCLVSGRSAGGAIRSIRMFGSLLAQGAATLLLKAPARLSGSVRLPQKTTEIDSRIAALCVHLTSGENRGVDPSAALGPRWEGLLAIVEIQRNGEFAISGPVPGANFRLRIDAPGAASLGPGCLREPWEGKWGSPRFHVVQRAALHHSGN